MADINKLVIEIQVVSGGPCDGWFEGKLQAWPAVRSAAPTMPELLEALGDALRRYFQAARQEQP